MLKGLTNTGWNLPDETVLRWFNDCRAEFDARHFNRFVGSLGISFTPEFLAFREAWRYEEFGHYLGFVDLLHLVTGRGRKDIREEVEARQPNFSFLKSLRLQDELTLLLVFMFEELGAVRDSQMDYQITAGLNPVVGKWMKLVGKDEATHYSNAAQVILLRHSDRAAEITAITDAIVRWYMKLGQELGGRDTATFAFDPRVVVAEQQLLNERREEIHKTLRKLGVAC